MADPFKLSAVAGAAIAEIEARSKTNARQEWFASRTNWAHVQSMCSNCTNWVKELSAFSHEPYTGGSIGGRPQPVIESIQVKQQGNLGTTRQATIKMLAFTQYQLDELFNCYCIPQMSIRVQFGWNKGATNTSAPAPYTAVVSDTEAICELNSKRDGSGVYDGLQGRVSSYNVNFNKDMMAWEVEVTVVAASSAVMSRPVEDMSTACGCKKVVVDPKTKEKKQKETTVSLFKSKLLNAVESSKDDEALGIKMVTLNHATRDSAGNESKTIGEMIYTVITLGFGTNTTEEPFITFAGIEKLLNTHSQSQADGKPLMAEYNSGKYGLISFKSPGYSADPDIVLFPGIDQGYDGLHSASCKSGDGIDIGKVAFNCIFVLKCLEEIGKDGTVQDFFSALFRGLSDATAGLAELSIIDTAACGSRVPVLSVIDLQKSSGVTAGTPIDVSPESAVLRDLKLTLKLPDAMMSQALYGNIRQNTTTNPCDEKKYKNQLPKNAADPESAAAPSESCPPDSCTEQKEDAASGKIEEHYKNLVGDVSSENKESVRTDLVAMYNKGAESDTCANVIMPWEMSMVFDGIGGIGFGQALTSNMLPSAVKSKYVYQVTSVEHSVTYGDWITTVNTKPRLVG